MQIMSQAAFVIN